MRNQVRTLTHTELDYFIEKLDIHTYNSQTQIIYYGQVPSAAFILLKGLIELKNSKGKFVKSCEPITMLGLNELTNHAPFKYTAEIFPGSEVLIIDRSSAFTMQQEKNENQLNADIVRLFP